MFVSKDNNLIKKVTKSQAPLIKETTVKQIVVKFCYDVEQNDDI